MKHTQKITVLLGGMFALLVFFVPVVQAYDQAQVDDLKKLLQEQAKNPQVGGYANQSLQILQQMEAINKAAKNALKTPLPASSIPFAPKVKIPTPVVETPPFQRDEIAKEAEKKFGIQIQNNVQDTNKDGVSDEVETALGLDPRASSTGDFSGFEKKLFGVDRLANVSEIEQKCAVGIKPGQKFSTEGFIVFAACPKNRSFTLFATASNGVKTAVETKTSSGNSKLIFTVDRKFASGNYVLQVEPAATTSFEAREGLASVLGASVRGSEPVTVVLVPTVGVSAPIAKKIEDVNIEGVRNVKVFRTGDGRIHVSGVADISSLVVGAFESAIFTSALIADSTGGYFEVVSSRPLELGDHHVSLYASRFDEGIQSKPVKLSFGLIEPQTASASSPMFVYVFVGLAVLGGGAFLFFRKKNA